MEITDLTPAEHRVWQAFPLGEGVDFRESPDEDPGTGDSWGPERTVRAEVLRALLLNGPTRDGETAGMKLTGARITGRLDLRYGAVEHPVRLRSCHFDGTPNSTCSCRSSASVRSRPSLRTAGTSGSRICWSPRAGSSSPRSRQASRAHSAASDGPLMTSRP